MRGKFRVIPILAMISCLPGCLMQSPKAALGPSSATSPRPAPCPLCATAPVSTTSTTTTTTTSTMITTATATKTVDTTATQSTTATATSTYSQTATQISSNTHVIVPVRELVTNSTTGNTRQSVFVQVGNSAPIEALLDTGSSGLRVLASSLEPSDYSLTGTPSTFSYASGLTLAGNVALATVTIGGVATPTPIPFQVVSSVSGSMGLTSPGPINGLTAILGVMLNGGTYSRNPLMEMGAQQWILNLAQPGSGGSGQLVLNPDQSDLAGYTTFPLTRSTVSYPGEPPPGGPDGWNSNQLPGCIENLDAQTSLCQNTLLDSGAWGFHETNFSGAEAAWAGGTRASINFTNQSGESVQLPFTVNDAQGAGVILPARAGNASSGALNTGPFPFFGLSVLYDNHAGEIGLKPRT